MPSSSLSVIESALGERDQANIAAKDAHRRGRARPAPPARRRSSIIDAGSTTARLAAVLPREHRLSVVTHAVPVAARLAGLPHIELHLLPGRVRPTTHAAVGTDTVAALGELRADVAFVATNGLTADFGLTTPDRDEAATKRAIVRLRAAYRRARRLLQDRRRDPGALRLARRGGRRWSPTPASTHQHRTALEQAGLEVVVA